MNTQGKPVRIAVNRNLYMEIIKLQARENLDWEQACTRATTLLGENSVKFDEAVNKKYNALHRSQMLTEMNKVKQVWINQGYKKGEADWKITYPCAVCAQPIAMKSGADDHSAMSDLLKKAGWAHTSCLKNK